MLNHSSVSKDFNVHKSLKNYALLIMSLALMACDFGSHYDPEEETMYVDYYREACDDESTDLCFRVRFDEEDSFSLTTLPMYGFDALEWGKRYIVTVETEFTDSGKDESYTLESIDHIEVMEPVSNDFVLTFFMSSGILKDNSSDGSGSSWIIAGEKIFTCESSDCDAITAAYNERKEIQLNFQAENDNLTLEAVKCYASEDDFSTECEGIVEVSWDIAHYKTDCGLYIPSFCNLYKETSESGTSWHLLQLDVDDFSYEWGIQYDIDVKADISAGSLESAIFKEENERDEITEDFRTVIRLNSESAKPKDGMLNYLTVTFDCGRYLKCNDIDDILDDLSDLEERIVVLKGTIESDYIGTLNPVIVVEKIVCDSDSSTFKVNCADSDDEVYWVKKG